MPSKSSSWWEKIRERNNEVKKECGVNSTPVNPVLESSTTVTPMPMTKGASWMDDIGAKTKMYYTMAKPVVDPAAIGVLGGGATGVLLGAILKGYKGILPGLGIGAGIGALGGAGYGGYQMYQAGKGALETAQKAQDTVNKLKEKFTLKKKKNESNG